MKKLALVLTLILSLLAFGPIGCDRDEGPLEEAAESIEEGTDEAADKVEEAGDKVEEQTE
ncbi:MAG: hypothetical protein ACLFOY_19410 [Desulfatibacillaceae bacterium]